MSRPGTGETAGHRAGGTTGAGARFDATVDRFRRSLEEVGGEFLRVPDLDAAVARIGSLISRTSGNLIWAPGCWGREIGLEALLRDAELLPLKPDAGRDRLAAAPVGVTDSLTAVAETGTILLGGQPGLWGTAAVLPPVHVALIRAADVVDELDAAFDGLEDRMAAGEGNWLWITGPSRTADIAKTLVRGVHGPHRLVALVIDSVARRDVGQARGPERP